MPNRTVSLDDKYTLRQGRVFITGTQALVRLPMTQHMRDQAEGLSTAGYVTGYRGSPLGTLDEQLGKASKALAVHDVVFVPGVNEDLAATAVWGSQQAEAAGEGKYDGVFAMWYGKGPGVDRTGDAFRHGNLAGSSKHGGVLVLMGDDHTCESSTTCHQSEFAMVDAMIPVLSPAGVQEILDFGLIGWALSRYSGCWVGIKCVKDTVEATASIDVDVDRVPDPAKRLLINDLVCEGCGDCGAKSNCVSLQPLETELGRKRTIDQSSCNKDYSCVKGFCPSFVTVLGGSLRKPARAGDAGGLFLALPQPELPSLDAGVYSILVTGMGGTGVVTIGAILGMAAHLQGLGCGILDMAGLAQKGGSVWSHLRFGRSPEAIKTIRIAAGGADLVLGCDMIVAGNSKTLAAARKGRTRMVVNTQETMPGEFSRNADMQYPRGNLQRNIVDAVGADSADFVEAGRIATALLGDSIAANMFMLGFAYQRGLIPVTADAIEQAIELNGAQQQMNRDAFLWGRRTVVDPDAVGRMLSTLQASQRASLSPAVIENLDEAIAWRKRFLVDYQNDAYARQYADFVEHVRSVERSSFPGRSDLTRAVAKYCFKLMAIKDEYEVARLYTETGFLQSVERQFEGDFKLVFNLAPPILSQRDSVTGEPRKREFGQWILPAFRLLAGLRFLRGTAFDVFGRTQERRMERALIAQYKSNIEQALAVIAGTRDAGHYEAAVKLAELPESIRGYGHVRARSVEAARQ